MKTYRELERKVRGYSNHRRIEILDLLGKRPELSVDEIASTLTIDYRTTSHHVRQLAISGLVMKRNDGPAVRQKLTREGEKVLAFLKAA